MTTFVIVHGAWVGAWAWMRVADRLIANRHRVFVPTLSGLGERSHLIDREIDLTTHINDVVNEILWKDLDDVVLVGHSYGGFVITGAAERVPDRIRSIVYVDAFIPKDGQAFADPEDGWELSGTSVPVPPSSKGDYIDEADRAWVDAKATPHPTASLTEKARITGAYQHIPRKFFVQAIGSDGASKRPLAKFASDPSWTVHQVACGHDIPIDKPDELVRILEAAA